MVQKTFSLPDDDDEDGLSANTNVLLESASLTFSSSSSSAGASSCDQKEQILVFQEVHVHVPHVYALAEHNVAERLVEITHIPSWET